MNPDGAGEGGLQERVLEALGYLGGKAADTVLYPLASDQRIYWVYLLSAMLIATGVFALQHPGKGAPRKLLGLLWPREVLGHPSAVVDYKFFLINRFTFAALIAPLLLSLDAVSFHTARLLGPLLGEPSLRQPAVVDQLAYTTAMLLAGDFATFFGHYLQHRVPFLWEFHKAHHSAQVLTPITVYRMHPVDDIVGGCVVALAMGLTDGVFRSLYATTPTTLLLLNLNVFVFLFFLAGYNLRHSHVWLSYPGWLSRVLISPAQHQIHHSKAERHHDRNLGFIFAVWDRIFRTLYVPREREALEYGLADDEHLEMNSVWQLYARPFRTLAARLSPAKGRPA